MKAMIIMTAFDFGFCHVIGFGQQAVAKEPQART